MMRPLPVEMIALQRAGQPDHVRITKCSDRLRPVAFAVQLGSRHSGMRAKHADPESRSGVKSLDSGFAPKRRAPE